MADLKKAIREVLIEAGKPPVVAHIIDQFKIVINKGADDGIKPGDRFLVYALSKDEIIDPESKKGLGKLELVKGTGTISYVQPHLSILESDRGELSWPTSILNPFAKIPKEPFDKAQVGDLLKKLVEAPTTESSKKQ